MKLQYEVVQNILMYLTLEQTIPIDENAAKRKYYSCCRYGKQDPLITYSGKNNLEVVKWISRLAKKDNRHMGLNISGAIMGAITTDSAEVYKFLSEIYYPIYYYHYYTWLEADYTDKTYPYASDLANASCCTSPNVFKIAYKKFMEYKDDSNTDDEAIRTFISNLIKNTKDEYKSEFSDIVRSYSDYIEVV